MGSLSGLPHGLPHGLPRGLLHGLLHGLHQGLHQVLHSRLGPGLQHDHRHKLESHQQDSINLCKIDKILTKRKEPSTFA